MKVLLEKDFLTYCPIYVRPAQSNLIIIGLGGDFLGCQDPGVGWWEEQGQFPEENKVNEFILRAVSVKHLVIIQLEDGVFQ